MKITKNKLIIGVLLIISSGLLCFFVANQSNSFQENTRILFQRSLDRQTRRNELFIVDQDGNNIQWLGHVTGPARWSNSGTYFAAGCFEGYESRKLCIYDAKTIPNYRKFVTQNYNLHPEIVQEFDLPQKCKDISSDTADFSGILSISWSYDDKSIAIVCDGFVNDDYQGHVCILPLDGEAYCWDESKVQGVFQVEWSPRDNMIATGGLPDQESIIYLVDPDGEKEISIAQGWGPEWSPDGKKLAYLGYSEDTEDGIYHQPGIGLVNKDGTGMKWLVPPDPSGGLFLDDCVNPSSICYLAWSPDGAFIAFIGGAVGPYNYHLISMNLMTGEMNTLIQGKVIGNYIFYPDWGTIE